MTAFKPYGYPYGEQNSGTVKGYLIHEPQGDALSPELKEIWREWIRENANARSLIHIPRGVQLTEPIYLDYRFNAETPELAEDIMIVAEANAQVTLLMDYSSDWEVAEVKHQGKTKVIARPGAHVTILKLQRLSGEAVSEDINDAQVEGDATVQWFTIDIGSRKGETHITNLLSGKGSQALIKSLFLGDGEREFKQFYEMIHEGSHSFSKIESQGALQDQSKSFFRGTLDIKPGAFKTEAEEGQKVLLLNPGVEAVAQPILLCGEDDVKANHAASAGQLEANQLYYLMSRGLSHQEAKAMIIEGAFRPLLDQIPVPAVQEKVQEEITRRLSYGKQLSN